MFIKPPSPKMTVNMESKRTPKDRVLQYNKTIEKKFSEISSILSVIDHTMKTFAEKLAQLKTIKDQMPQSVQSSISKTELMLTVQSVFLLIALHDCLKY
jgi:hypothetical protein